jgi:hypothetical protein
MVPTRIVVLSTVEREMKHKSFLSLICALIFASLAMPANAQATRTWVSGVGDDANPCSRTAPCKTFAGSIAKTTTGGEINCLDPGGFGALTITKSITIVCGQSGLGGVLVSGTNGLVVSNPGTSMVVVLDGLDIEGLTTGLSGVLVNGNGTSTVIIRNCSIRDFQNGVSVAVTSGSTQVIIQNSIIAGNGLGGATNGGVSVVGAGGAFNGVDLVNSLLYSNTNFNVQANGTSGTANVVLAGSQLIGTNPNIVVTGGGNVFSYGNNVLRPAATPTQTFPLQ